MCSQNGDPMVIVYILALDPQTGSKKLCLAHPRLFLNAEQTLYSSAQLGFLYIIIQDYFRTQINGTILYKKIGSFSWIYRRSFETPRRI